MVKRMAAGYVGRTARVEAFAGRARRRWGEHAFDVMALGGRGASLGNGHEARGRPILLLEGNLTVKQLRPAGKKRGRR